MRRDKISTSKITIIISLLLFGLAVFQFTAFRSDLLEEQSVAIRNTIETVHASISEQISESLSQSDDHTAKFASLVDLKVPFPDSFAIVVNSDGKILASENEALLDTDFFSSLSSAVFPDGSQSSLKEAVTNASSYWTEYSTLEDSFYLYTAPVSENNWSLILVMPSTIIQGTINNVSDVISKYTSTILILVIILASWLYFIHFYDTIRLTRNKASLVMEHKRYHLALESSKNTIWEYRVAEDKLYMDESELASLCGIKPEGSDRKVLLNRELIYPEDHTTLHKFFDSLISMEPTIHTELRIRNREGIYEWYELSGSKIFDKDGYPVSIIGQVTNINEQRMQMEALKEKALQDSLTKLYNYNAFMEKVSSRIANMGEPTIFAIMLIDIDDFNRINETYGYVFSDAILLDVAGRLRKLFSNNSILGRYGADQFVVLLDFVPSISYVEDMAQYIINMFHGIYAGNKNQSISGSIGISIYPVDDVSYEGLYSKAEMALYDAKRRGKGRYSLYNDQMASLPDSERYNRFHPMETKVSTFEDRSAVDSNLIANAIDILFDSRDIDVSISMMLSLIGIYYNLDHIFIVKYSNDALSASVTHEWYIDGKNAFDEHLRSEPVSSSGLFTPFIQNAQGIYLSDDLTRLADPSLLRSDELYKKNTRGLFQCGIRYQNDYIGYVSICTCDKPRSWKKNETDSLSLLSKIIGSYILHLHSEERFNFVSQMDPLTGTYNFNAFLGKVNEIFAEHPDKKYAVFYSDIYQFKLINDNYGYPVGDYILTALSSILCAAGSPEDIVCRITGDKYVALYEYETQDELLDKVKHIVSDSRHIRQPNGDTYRLVLKLGIYTAVHGDTAIVAVDRANIARKNVQDYHLSNYVFYTDDMHHSLLEQKEIEDAMEQALENHEFILYYQPKIDITTKTIFGAEALVRWKRPGHGLVPPDRFIPLFEDNGFIVSLDYYVLDSVCATLRSLIDSGHSVYPVSVNFSRVHLSSNELPTVLRATLEKYEIPAWLIEVELTESALGASDHYQISILNEIHEIGCRLSMDDFGSGLSSLNVLRDLPFDVIKIDKDFLHSRSTTFRERIVITNIVRMALDLNMDIICEGVETEEQELFLKRIGCFYAQGFLYAPPMPEDKFIATYLEEGIINEAQI